MQGSCPTVITRVNGEHVVLMSMADYNSMTETLHLLSTEANAKRLWKSIASLRAGKVLDQELIHDESEKAQKHRNKQEARAAVLGWTVEGWEDYLWWQENNPKIVREINKLVQECLRDPFKGTGKPEPLKGDLTGFWSRRITDRDRLVYYPGEGRVVVMMCRLHYS